MRIDILTAFPSILGLPLSQSIVGKAQTNGFISISTTDPRDFTTDVHRTIDDEPYGGGPGMLMKPEPVFRAYDSILHNNKIDKLNVIYPSPDGKVFNQHEARQLKDEKHIVFICGHYKGIDQRIRDTIVSKEYSIGDYVITGGELSSLVIIDSIIRLIPGVLNNMESAQSDSFESDLLDCGYYTRPEEYRGLKVPKILLSGNHQKIDDYRQKDREQKTKKKRPDIWKKYNKI